MKVIFLDIDGVLNSVDYWQREGQRCAEGFNYPTKRWWAAGIDPRCVRKLNRLIRDTGAKVIVSSTWRHGATLDFLQEILEMRGFRGEVIGKTPHLSGRPRCAEITMWLATYDEVPPVEAYVILDDDVDAEISSHYVKTSNQVGLTDMDVAAAKVILGD